MTRSTPGAPRATSAIDPPALSPVKSDATPPDGDNTAAFRWWMPRLWVGMDTAGLVKLFARNRFRIAPAQLSVAAADLLYSVPHTGLKWLQQLLLGRAVARTKMAAPPLFILGHWRCGTTLLHELLILDERHTFPTTWQCVAPSAFLFTEPVMAPRLKWLLPERRVMDNMLMGWDRPQEDEFALCNLGVPSPYLTVAFPNEPAAFPEYLDLEGLSPAALDRWKLALLRFMQQITWRTPKRIVLKSPPHTARIKVLLELFPDARFVYLVRNPYKVFPSTVHLWKSLQRVHAFQRPKFAGIEEYVLETFARMHRKYEETRHLIPPENLVELRYEELVRNPLRHLESIYERLQLGEFEPIRAAAEHYLSSQQNYQTNRYELSPEMRAAISTRWRDYIERHGYDTPDGQATKIAPDGADTNVVTVSHRW
ncbi:MAG: sulfotransferase [Pirellulales bacterium]|nr:sulfotransferase [Pirellulales bacterium]